MTLTSQKLHPVSIFYAVHEQELSETDDHLHSDDSTESQLDLSDAMKSGSIGNFLI